MATGTDARWPDSGWRGIADLRDLAAPSRSTVVTARAPGLGKEARPVSWAQRQEDRIRLRRAASFRAIPQYFTNVKIGFPCRIQNKGYSGCVVSRCSRSFSTLACPFLGITRTVLFSRASRSIYAASIRERRGPRSISERAHFESAILRPRPLTQHACVRFEGLSRPPAVIDDLLITNQSALDHGFSVRRYFTSGTALAISHCSIARSWLSI